MHFYCLSYDSEEISIPSCQEVDVLQLYFMVGHYNSVQPVLTVLCFKPNVPFMFFHSGTEGFKIINIKVVNPGTPIFILKTCSVSINIKTASWNNTNKTGVFTFCSAVTS